GLPDPALHLVGPNAEMGVARVGVAPRVEDGDHWLARHVFRAEALLPGPGAMTERPHVLLAEPAVAAQLGGCLAGHASFSLRARATGASVSSFGPSRAETKGGIGPVRATPPSSVAWWRTRAGPQASRRSSRGLNAAQSASAPDQSPRRHAPSMRLLSRGAMQPEPVVMPASLKSRR